MRTAKSIPRKKPRKPYPDFPLYPHATGRWAKRIRGKLYYFGPWADPQGALSLYLAQRDDLYAGRRPRRPNEGLTVRELCNRFLNTKSYLVRTGELSQFSWNDYHKTCERVIRVFGKSQLVDDLRVDDFEQLRRDMAKTLGPVSIGNDITRVRVLFKYAYDAELIDRPVRYGPGFKRPSKKAIRVERNKKGPRFFEPNQIRRLIDVASDQLAAMTLLGINCGLGNSDIALLTLRSVCLDSGWLDYPRPKTGIMRRAKIWPETIAALSTVIKHRPIAKHGGTDDLVFVTKYGRSWAKATSDNPITKEFRKLLDVTGIYRPGLSFYALRHTFETVAGESRDQVAVDHIMGHAPHSNDMAAVYRERISDERLIAVADFVRQWLFK
jgi:integrase